MKLYNDSVEFWFRVLFFYYLCSVNITFLSIVGFILNVERKAHKSGLWVIARRVAVITVAVSVAVMVVAFAIVDGYRAQLSDAVGAIAGDYKLSGVESGARWNTAPIAIDSLLENKIRSVDGVQNVMPIIRSGGVVKNGARIKGVAVVGVDIDKLNESKIGKYITDKDSSEGLKDKLIISQSLARELEVEVGQEVVMIFFQNSPILLNVTVGAVFDTHMEEIDKGIIWLPIEQLANWLGYEKGFVDFYQISVDSPNSHTEEQLYELTNESIVLEDAQEEYAYIYEWIVMLNNNIAILLIILSIVVGVNIIAVVLIVILESTTDIGILKSLGIKSRSLMLLYGVKTLLNTITGVVIGLGAGVVFCILQREYGLIKLDPVSYLVDAVPIDISWIGVGFVGVGAVIIVTIFAMLPTFIVARISPHKTLKFE